MTDDCLMICTTLTGHIQNSEERFVWQLHAQTYEIVYENKQSLVGYCNMHMERHNAGKLKKHYTK